MSSYKYSLSNYSLFNDLLTDAFFTNANEEISESDQQFTISFDLPGYKKEDVELSAENQCLSVLAKNEKRGTFTRKYQLGQEIDVDNISAKLEYGNMIINLPKSSKSLKRKIAVI